MKIFKCDNCGNEFPSPIEEERYKDEHGVEHIFDLCAPCRVELETERKNLHHNFFKKMVKEK